jgi:hypothetical protein
MNAATITGTHETTSQREEYSPISHLAHICWMSHWKEGLFGMLTVAFDASGHPTQPVLVVAGFIASVEDWILFDREWKDRLAYDGLTSFHMQSFAQSSGVYRTWKKDEARRRKLLADLTGMIFKHAQRKFGAAVVNSDLIALIDDDARKAFALSAYGIAGRGAAGNVDEWTKENPAERAVRYVFEDGDFNKGDLMRRMKEDGFATPIFEPKTDRPGRNGIPVPGFTPLQAADILAYEYMLAVERERDPKFPTSRWGHVRFDEMPGDIGKFTVQDIGRIGGHFAK